VGAQLSRVFEREFTETRLRRSEWLFRTIIEHVSDIVHMVDPRTVIRYITPSVGRILGHTPAELEGQSCYDFIHPEDRDRIKRIFESYIEEGGTTPTTEARLRHRDGSWRTFEVTGEITGMASGEPMIVVTSHDVTDRKMLEEQLRHSQKMEAVGQLAGGIAHDFNNLLTAIIGNADLLLSDLPVRDPRREDAEEIRKAADRAASLTQQLLAFGRRQVLQVQVVALDSLLENLDKMLRRLIGQEVALTTRVPATLGRVKIDPRQIEQVIINLVVNARDAMPGGGQIRIEADDVVLDEEYARTHVAVVPGRYVRLCVSDTGHGMDAAVQAHVFEPFFTTKEQGKGTGLGLSTVYGIVKQSGGYVWVYSEAGVGTTFKIYLPWADHPASAPALEASGPGESAPGTETVLLVEDEAPVRQMARRVLERSGYRVVEAHSGEQALELCDRQRVHLVLTDVLMQGLNGRQVYDAVRTRQPRARVLFMSGYTDEFIVERGLLAADQPFLQKPFSPGALLHKVREVLDRDRSLTA
jgi:two-component system, cell cycle sensor histidine kinase and response regulator CckA